MRELEDLDAQEIPGLIQDAVRNIFSHTAFWFQAAEEELGTEEAIRLDSDVWETGFPLQLRRLWPKVSWEERESKPTLLMGLGKEELIALLIDLAHNWLTNDGVWFRTVEDRHGMVLAKKLNDRALGRFSYLEAKRIMKRLPLAEGGGLAALEQALKFRLYARINRQEALRLGEGQLVFRMNDCRVQQARQRQRLPEYPCQSAGTEEYSSFARAIDSRLETRCLACPPGPHPEEYWCAWEFSLKK